MEKYQIEGIPLSYFRAMAREEQDALRAAIPAGAEWVRIGGYYEVGGQDHFTVLDSGPLSSDPTEGDWVEDGYILRVANLVEKCDTCGGYASACRCGDFVSSAPVLPHEAAVILCRSLLDASSFLALGAVDVFGEPVGREKIKAKMVALVEQLTKALDAVE